MEKEKGNS